MHPKNANLGICSTCGHLVAFFKEECGVSAYAPDYAWLKENFTEKDREECHEAQERHHEARGHWG